MPAGTWDVVVVGAGVAGLQTALTLGRACRRVLIVDDGRPRNAQAEKVTNFLAAPDLTPGQLLDAGARMLDPYDVTRVAGTVTTVEGTARSRFVLRVGALVFRARAVVLAEGVEDVLPPVPGLQELWGRQVVACPHCHGWEVRGRPVAQFGFVDDPEHGADRAVLLSRWSDHVTFFSGRTDLPDGLAIRLELAGVAVRPAAPDGVTIDGDGLAVRCGGREERFARIFTAVRHRAHSDLAERLGCRRVGASSPGALVTDPAGRTSVDGVWAVGSVTHPTFLAIAAAGHAAMVATQVHAWLTEDELGDDRPVGV